MKYTCASVLESTFINEFTRNHHLVYFLFPHTPSHSHSLCLFSLLLLVRCHSNDTPLENIFEFIKIKNDDRICIFGDLELLISVCLYVCVCVMGKWCYFEKTKIQGEIQSEAFMMMIKIHLCVFCIVYMVCRSSVEILKWAKNFRNTSYTVWASKRASECSHVT